MSAPQRERLWAVRVGFLEEVVRRGNPIQEATRGPGLSHPPLPLLGCVVSGKPLNLSEPQFAHLPIGIDTTSLLGTFVKGCAGQPLMVVWCLGSGVQGPVPSQVPEISVSFQEFMLDKMETVRFISLLTGPIVCWTANNPNNQGLRSYPRPFRKHSVSEDSTPRNLFPSTQTSECFSLS